MEQLRSNKSLFTKAGSKLDFTYGSLFAKPMGCNNSEKSLEVKNINTSF